MIDRFLTAAALAALPATAAAAIQPPQPVVVVRPPVAAPEPARLAAAERLVSAIYPEELLSRAAADAVRQYWPGWAAARGTSNPRDPYYAERLRTADAAATTETARAVRNLLPELRTLMGRFYAERMTTAELDQAARFYASPAGRRFILGSIQLSRHADALRDYSPEPDPRLLAGMMVMGARIEAATRHLQPPRPPMPPMQTTVEPERRPRADRPQRRERTRRPREEPPEMTVHIPEDADHPPTPPPPPPPPPPPADPARLAAARRAAEAILPTDAFSQPLPLQELAATLLALPVSSLGPVPLPPGIGPHATVGEAAETHVPHLREGARIAAGILSEDLPRLLPFAAPIARGALAELYAREFTVAELDEISRFYGSPAGQALARQSLTAMVDPPLIRDSLLLMPRIVPEVYGTLVRIGQSTAHLPPPPAPPAPSAPPAAAAAQPSEEGPDEQ
jgi:hypothetical protein